MMTLLNSPKVGRITAWRARRLTTRRTRERLAAAVDRAVATRRERAQWLTRAGALDPSGVVAERERLRDLADRLRAPEPVYAQGVTLVARLVSRSDSPLYHVDGNLDRQVRKALAALNGHFH